MSEYEFFKDYWSDSDDEDLPTPKINESHVVEECDLDSSDKSNFWDDDEEIESDIEEVECENYLFPKIYENSLFDLAEDEIQGELICEHKNLSSFKLYNNELFDSDGEENESSFEKFEFELSETLPSQINNLINDFPCIDDNIPLMDVC